MDFKQAKGATLIDDEQKQGLIPNLTTQEELNEFEAANILEAVIWAKTSKKLKAELLEASGVLLLHKKMYGKTWKWAGHWRHKATNIGNPPRDIQNNLRILLGDVKYWLEHKTYPMDEIALRFHHRLVEIHLFPNGNGRHARLMADLLMQYHGGSKFTWGSENLVKEGDAREQYILALQRLDKDRDDVGPLLAFARG